MTETGSQETTYDAMLPDSWVSVELHRLIDKVSLSGKKLKNSPYAKTLTATSSQPKIE